MTMRAALGLVMVMLVPLVLGAVPRTETQAYTTGEGETALPNAFWPPANAIPPLSFPHSPFPACPPMNVGGACFTLDGSEHSVLLRLNDTLAPAVAADAQFLNATGRVLTSGAFCKTTNMTIPPGAKTLEVLLYNAALGAPVCGVGKLIEPTTGTIVANYS